LENAAIIVAAGKGLRAGGETPKQWRDLAGRNAVAWSLAAFRAHPAIGRIVLVLNPDDMGLAAGYEDVAVVAGGANRAASVRAGLDHLAQNPPDNVLIHDVARPAVSARIISDVIAALTAYQGAAPALAVTDALWRGRDGQVDGTTDRDGLFRAQTPQGFQFAAILAAHQTFKGEAADDVAIARAAGMAVAIVKGDEDNLKITLPADFKRAETILRGAMDIRVGNGFDVHAFTAGDHVVLCGVSVPHDHALKGHSDADVAMHAITDAIYGALAMGDIGQSFPPSDPRWKGAASDVFLRHAVKLAEDEGYVITHMDCTIICELPKIGPHAMAMRQNLASITGLDVKSLSVKATTSERLGFTGRGEGIAAMATATLVKS
jgi:2-C-methyl-D-erythritol 4-phosphate cytidylyltransferase / 2-C-methyl-D-erythritol 2,4-cyclodiphosphate synthase